MRMTTKVLIRNVPAFLKLIFGIEQEENATSNWLPVELWVIILSLHLDSY